MFVTRCFRAILLARTSPLESYELCLDLVVLSPVQRWASSLDFQLFSFSAFQQGQSLRYTSPPNATISFPLRAH